MVRKKALQTLLSPALWWAIDGMLARGYLCTVENNTTKKRIFFIGRDIVKTVLDISEIKSQRVGSSKKSMSIILRL